MLQKVSEGRQYCKSGPDFRLSAVWACISLIDVSNGLLDLYPKSVLDIRSLSYAVSLAVMRQGCLRSLMSLLTGTVHPRVLRIHTAYGCNRYVHHRTPPQGSTAGRQVSGADHNTGRYSSHAVSSYSFRTTRRITRHVVGLVIYKVDRGKQTYGLSRTLCWGHITEHRILDTSWAWDAVESLWSSLNSPPSEWLAHALSACLWYAEIAASLFVRAAADNRQMSGLTGSMPRRSSKCVLA
jgi:hypothetical protein